MSFDFAKVLGGLGAAVGAVEATMRQAMEDAFKKGFEAGREDMRQVILNAAQSSAVSQNASGQTKEDKKAPDFQLVSLKPKRTFKGRVEKGSINLGIDAIFALEEGLTIPEIHKRLHEAGVQASRDGVGVNLRRNDGSKYRREGDKWFRIIEPKF